MSLSTAVRTPRSAPGTPAKAPGRRLRQITSPPARRKPKLAYALVALGGAMAIAAAQIILSLAITQDSYTLASLSSQQRSLDLRTAALQEELTGVGSPQALASEAAALGMVVAGSPSYLRLSDGAVFGTGTGAGGASTVDPSGSGAVSNALLAAPAQADAPVASEPVVEAEQLPPAITDGLPTPETR
ncbi:hypothetical protein [Microbacterium sp.]|uniref:hypothetical protein n=1 Tax=Microbacterium sp. TaxID=51671 RepID=UPI0039E46BBC